MLEPISIDATTLPDAWFQCVYTCLSAGKSFTIDKGSYEGDKRLEFDYITIRIRNPQIRPLLPRIPPQYNIPDPCTEEYLNNYMPYLMTAAKKPLEMYTYGERIFGVVEGCLQEDGQVGEIIKRYRKFGGRNNQLVLQIAQPSDLSLEDPPCLREIDTRIQEDKLHFFPRFRSWDLFGGFPANLAAIQNLKEYMADEIGVGYGETIASSKGLHLYSYVIQLAELLRHRTVKELRYDTNLYTLKGNT